MESARISPPTLAHAIKFEYSLHTWWIAVDDVEDRAFQIHKSESNPIPCPSSTSFINLYTFQSRKPHPAIGF